MICCLTQATLNQGVYGHTLIVFLADHGEGLGDHGEENHGFFIYNSTLHVPLIFKLPAAGARRQVTQAVSTVEVLPTILGELQIAVPKAVQGRTLAAALRGRTADASPIYSESFLPRLHFNWSELRGLQDQSYKFIGRMRELRTSRTTTILTGSASP